MENPNVATSLNTQLYTSQGQYANAEPLYKRSLVIKEKVLGPDHPDVAVSLNGLAELYRMQGAANVRLSNVIFYLGIKTASLFAVGPTQAQTCRLRRDIVLKLHWS